MYRWMLVLRRLFDDPTCPEPRPGLDFVSHGNEEFQGRWDKCHPSMLDAQLSHEAHSSESRGSDTGRPSSRYQPTGQSQQPPSYESIMTQMKSCQVPAVFRQQEHTPPPLLAAGDGASQSRRRRRQEDDTFLPPHGPPVRWPLNLGEGEEFGLPEHVQHLWDFNLDRAVFVDHANKAVFYEDPRGADRATANDQLQQPCQQPTKYVIYREPEGRQSSTADILLSPENLSVLEAEKMAEAARSKPQLIVISSCGLNGVDGLKGEDGRDGHPGEEGMPACIAGGRGEDGGRGGDGGRGLNGEDGEAGEDGHSFHLLLSGNPASLRVSGGGLEEDCVDMGRDAIIFADLHGGRGGRGGAGGCGGHGGRGGGGGPGGRGEESRSGEGDRGGDGGCGGNGGTVSEDAGPLCREEDAEELNEEESKQALECTQVGGHCTERDTQF
ncbi:hypothetical protein BOX15_Mlig010679g1 [Macrostomum lignano]|uniref:Uncharacterized protein n=1 Tax=Macrostomum lignano TaxID=282301 RepID=A0A267D9G1_9PLAT|nr:hypothetical protein BOX15_Mlig010679g1 [Macrostomum lignano]